MSFLPDVRIDAPSVIGRDAKVYLNGKELPGVRALKVEMSANDETLLKVELVANSLTMNFPAALEVMVALHEKGLISVDDGSVPEASADADS